MATTTEDKTQLIAKKIDAAKKIIAEALETYPHDKLAIAWTGGKDSTLVLWLIRQVCLEQGIPIPQAFCIDEGDMFDEIRAFLAEWAEKWDVKLDMIHNHDVSRAAGGVLGNTVKVSALNARNRKEVERLGYEEDEFDYEPESFVGNHLMKTATLNVHLEAKGIAAFVEGIRWDEQGARANEQYFSPRKATSLSPEHMRVCPILHFTERDVWDAHFQYEIPICALYKQGFRSLGARVTTRKVTDVPAWEQDLENTTERGGRRQDKEGLMEKLRSLGYM
ncbi:MAG: phosphoadenosine phosphosulfate reductase family protein [Kiritimatiellae bacterium]|nr:phosphoadenosine phosphosulfate reductase family protein [Kiritimatiellia bacterium]